MISKFAIICCLSRYPANETGYPAGHRISKQGQISGQPDIQFNPKSLLSPCFMITFYSISDKKTLKNFLPNLDLNKQLVGCCLNLPLN